MTALSIIFAFRDRDVQRVERCLASVAQQTFTDFEVLFVDYGSQPQTAQAVKEVVKQYTFARYLYTETRGYAWNRSHALNIAARQAQGKYILTNDVDMIFLPNFLEVMLEYANPQRELHISPYWLPENFTDWENVATYQEHLEQIGTAGRGICLLSTAVFHEIRGYDEYYRYYGVEDRDMSLRLQLMGLEDYWVNDETAIFHQWHPVANYNTENLMPPGVMGRMEIHFQTHAKEVVRNSDDWGKLYTRENRPVLRFVDVDKQKILECSELQIIILDPTENQSIEKLSKIFFELPSGFAIAVNHAFFPKRTPTQEFVKKSFNRFLHRISPGTQSDYPLNRLHGFVVNLVEPPAATIADYYLNLPVIDGVSVVMKA